MAEKKTDRSACRFTVQQAKDGKPFRSDVSQEDHSDNCCQSLASSVLYCAIWRKRKPTVAPAVSQFSKRKMESLSLPYTFTATPLDRKSTRLNSSHLGISYAVFCLKK